MLTASALVPIIGSLGVSIYWLCHAASIRYKTNEFHKIEVEVAAEAQEKFPDDSAKGSKWRDKEIENRTRKLKLKSRTARDIDTATMVGEYPQPLSQIVCQWILIGSSAAGVILMALNL